MFKTNRTLGIIVFIFLALGVVGCSDRGSTTKSGSDQNNTVTEEPGIGTIKKLDQSKVIEDSESGISLVKDQIIIIFKENVSKDSIEAKISNINGQIVGYLADLNIYQVEISGNPSIDEIKSIIEQLNNDDDIEAASLNSIAKTNVTTNDSEYDGDLWDELNPGGKNEGLEIINAPTAWVISTGNSNVKIGVIDGGIDMLHEDINISGEHIFNSAKPEYSNGDCKDEEECNKYYSHGTHVTGIIGALSNNDKGIAGVIWDKEIYFYRTDFQNYSYLYGVRKLLSQGVKVINLSIGYEYKDCYYGSGSGCPSSESFSVKFDKKVNTAFIKLMSTLYGDFLIVQSAGNNGIDVKYNGVFSSIDDEVVSKKIINVANARISLGCYQDCGYELSPSSNIGSLVSVAAPGDGIYSTIPDSKYEEKSGTSMAAPFVTGVAGLIWSVRPDLSAEEYSGPLSQDKKTRCI